jgi:hypothetical protein
LHHGVEQVIGVHGHPHYEWLCTAIPSYGLCGKSTADEQHFLEACDDFWQHSVGFADVSYT